MSSYDMSRKTRHYYLITWQWATPVQQWMTAGDGGSPEKKQKLDQKLGQSADDVVDVDVEQPHSSGADVDVEAHPHQVILVYPPIGDDGLDSNDSVTITASDMSRLHVSKFPLYQPPNAAH